MKQLVNGFVTHMPEVILLAGAAAVAVGVGMLCLPAGVIAGGGLAMAGAVFSIWGAGDDK